MKERLGLFLLAAISLSACNEQKGTGNSSASESTGTGRSYSVFAQIRPKADPNIIRDIEKEDIEKQRQQQAELEKQLAAQQGERSGGLAAFLDPSKRNLPEVGKSSVGGGPLPSGTLPNQVAAEPAAAPAVAAQPMDSSAWTPPAGNNPYPMPPAPVASYNTNYTAAPAAGFVPPPPAVSVTGSIPGIGAPPPPQYAAYPYPYPYPAAPPPQEAYQPAPDKMARSTSTIFANPNKPSQGDDEETPKKKDKNVVVITPTGMPPLSPFKQRDDLKALWQGTLNTTLKNLTRDEKLAQQLKKVEVALPAESTKGSLSVSQRVQDSLFKNVVLDKKFVAQVKKSQSELIQAYYRYLFSYNKFSLTQQNVAARKQEMELADSSAEKQRAAADLAQAQQEAESSKDDMRAAQNDLAAITGGQSARWVIGRVSGVTPSLESLAQADSGPSSDQQESSIGGFFNSVGKAFGLNNQKQEPKEEEKVAKAETKDKGKDKEKDKGKDKKKGNKGDKTQIAAAPQEPPVPSRSTSVESAAVSPAPQGAVSFELKDVKTTPRKSILRVSIRNNGGENFSFDTESVSVSEGNNKLADAAVRAEFDATIIQPSQEVTGTITIFGRPWNDKLSVSLSDGGKTILLHR